VGSGGEAALTSEVRDLRSVLDGYLQSGVDLDVHTGFIAWCHEGGRSVARLINSHRIEVRVNRGPNGPQRMELCIIEARRAADLAEGLRVQGRGGELAIVPVAANAVILQEVER